MEILRRRQRPSVDRLPDCCPALRASFVCRCKSSRVPAASPPAKASKKQKLHADERELTDASCGRCCQKVRVSFVAAASNTLFLPPFARERWISFLPSMELSARASAATKNGLPRKESGRVSPSKLKAKLARKQTACVRHSSSGWSPERASAATVFPKSRRCPKSACRGQGLHHQRQTRSQDGARGIQPYTAVCRSTNFTKINKFWPTKTQRGSLFGSSSCVFRTVQVCDGVSEC